MPHECMSHTSNDKKALAHATPRKNARKKKHPIETSTGSQSYIHNAAQGKQGQNAPHDEENCCNISALYPAKLIGPEQGPA